MNENFERDIRRIARAYRYPAAPQVQLPARAGLHGRRLQIMARAAVLLLIVGLALITVPPLRAAVYEIFQIGVVRVIVTDESGNEELLDLRNLAGEVTLTDAQTRTAFTLKLPQDDLPDRVYLQDESLVIFIWLDGTRITQALYQIDQMNWFITKQAPSITQTDVAGKQAYWFDYGHPVLFERGGEAITRLTHFVDGHVLVWADGRMTYRLETHGSLDEARRTAASLVPFGER